MKICKSVNCNKPLIYGKYCKECVNLPENCIRSCPECTNKMQYGLRSNMLAAEKLKKICIDCYSKKLKIKYKGIGNPFYNKKHTQEFKDKISINRQGWFKGIKNPNKGNKGSKNPMFGISFYDKWVEKYGLVEANKRLLLYKEKQSLSSSGSKNRMFNKVPGIGSGNGISGWYKNWYFRSLNELSYMLFVIERFNLNWKSAENKQYAIKYKDLNNNDRNYFPDFIINNKYIIEIKPKALRNTEINKLKFQKAFGYFKDLKFKVVCSPRIISKQELKNLIMNNQVKLVERWNTKIS